VPGDPLGDISALERAGFVIKAASSIATNWLRCDETEYVS